jgi:hypothetical protein
MGVYILRGCLLIVPLLVEILIGIPLFLRLEMMEIIWTLMDARRPAK